MVIIHSRPAAPNNWASDEYALGRRERKVGAILHWMAGYLPGTTSMFQNPATGYSTSLGVGTRDGRGNGLEAHRYVPADGYAYGSYNPYADRRGESIEIENDIHLPYPGKPTPEVHEYVAQLLAQLCVDEDWPLIGGARQLVLGDFPDHRYYQSDIPGFGVDFNILTHRSVAWKDCPGTTDVQWIVARANEILSGSGDNSNEEDDDMPIVYQNKSDGNSLWAISPETIQSYTDPNKALAAAKYGTSKGVIVVVDSGSWPSVLSCNGIPADKVPLPGGFWSRARDSVVSSQAATASVAKLFARLDQPTD